MRAFRDWSIEWKLLAIGLLTSSVVVLVGFAVLIAGNMMASRQAIVQELSTIAEIIGQNATAALVFDDADTAHDLLSALSANENVVYAGIARSDGTIIAEYVNSANQRSTAAALAWQRHHRQDDMLLPPDRRVGPSDEAADHIDVFAPIAFNGQGIGSVMLISDLESVRYRIKVDVVLAAIAFVLSICIAFIMSSRLQTLISGPILKLAEAMRAVSSRNDYSIRVRPRGQDELGVLIAGFNDMLARIEAHGASLEAARWEADAANRAKSEFLANTSHELRTPLNAILGFSEIMAKETFGPLGSPRYCAYARDINASGVHLLKVINDILDISKIEAGKLELKEEPIEVGHLVQGALRLVGAQAERAGVGLAAEVEGNLPCLRADQRLVKQSLVNLLANGIKFTPPGGRVGVRARRGGDGSLAVSVSDTGIGIAAADIPRALAPFSQVDGSLSRKYDGAGLGLPLVKSFVELHGGSLDIASEVGAGTTVTLRFPAERMLPPSQLRGDDGGTAGSVTTGAV